MTVSDLQEQLVDDLAIAITKHRRGKGAGKMARELLNREATTDLLVGLTENAREAVYHDAMRWGVRMVEFDAEGIDGLSASWVERCRHRDEMELLVRENCEMLRGCIRGFGGLIRFETTYF